MNFHMQCDSFSAALLLLLLLLYNYCNSCFINYTSLVTGWSVFCCPCLVTKTSNILQNTLFSVEPRIVNPNYGKTIAIWKKWNIKMERGKVDYAAGKVLNVFDIFFCENWSTYVTTCDWLDTSWPQLLISISGRTTNITTNYPCSGLLGYILGVSSILHFQINERYVSSVVWPYYRVKQTHLSWSSHPIIS